MIEHSGVPAPRGFIVPHSRSAQSRSDQLIEAADTLRCLILAGESYRQAVAGYLGVGVTDTVAISNLAVQGSLWQTELARLLWRTTSSVTSMVDRLEAAGFVERTTHPDDRRRAVIQLTERGGAALQRSRDWFALAFDDVSADALPHTVELLRSLTAGLGRSTAAISAEHVEPL